MTLPLQIFLNYCESVCIFTIQTLVDMLILPCGSKIQPWYESRTFSVQRSNIIRENHSPVANTIALNTV